MLITSFMLMLTNTKNKKSKLKLSPEPVKANYLSIYIVQIMNHKSCNRVIFFS